MRLLQFSALIVLGGCLLSCVEPPLSRVQRGMLLDSKQDHRKSLDDKVLLAVQQIVRTLKPEYQECHELYQREPEIPGYHMRRQVGQDCKYTLGFVDICDLHRLESDQLHKYLTEKVLTYAFLQDVFARHYRFVERIPLSIGRGVGLGQGQGPGVNIPGATIIYDNAAGPTNNVAAPRSSEAEKNRISTIRERVRNGGLAGSAAWPQASSASDKMTAEIAAIDKKIAELEKKPKTDAIAAEIDKLQQYKLQLLKRIALSDIRGDDAEDNLMKVNPEAYNSQTIAKFLGQRYNLDVIKTGFLMDLGDYYELTLRMIETRHGQVIAVGSVKIERDLIGFDRYFF